MIFVILLFIFAVILLSPATVDISYEKDLIINIRLPIVTLELSKLMKKSGNKKGRVPFSGIVRALARGIRFSSIYVNEISIPGFFDGDTNLFGYDVGLRLLLGTAFAYIDKNAKNLILKENAVNLDSSDEKITLDVSIKTRLCDILYTVFLIMREKSRGAKRKEAK